MQVCIELFTGEQAQVQEQERNKKDKKLESNRKWLLGPNSRSYALTMEGEGREKRKNRVPRQQEEGTDVENFDLFFFF